MAVVRRALSWRSDTTFAATIQLATLLAVVLVWHLASANKWVSPLILPTVPGTAGKFVELLGDRETYHQLSVTLYEFGGAMLIALGLGLAVGIVCGTIKYLGDLLEPILLALYAITIIMAFPLCILFFGIGSASKIAFGGVYAFFPIAITTMKALRHVDRSLIRAAVSMGASRRQLLLSVMVPAAFPMIIAGVRLGAVHGLLAVVAGEMLAALEGTGQMLARSVELFFSAEAFSWILLTILMVTLVNVTLSWLERRIGGR